MQEFAKQHTSQLHKSRESDGWKQRTHDACRWSECLARCSKVHGKGAGEVEAKQGQVRNRCPVLRTQAEQSRWRKQSTTPLKGYPMANPM